jgi:branched-chain amino acid transport system ATP-binding protein
LSASSNTPFLSIRDVRKHFGGIRAVDGVSFEVNTGRITGLIGPNGAGKTTLFNLITAIHRLDKGEIVFQGKRIDGLRPDQIFHKKIFRTFQVTKEFRQMTVLENLMIVPPEQVGERIWYTWFRQGLIRRQEKEIQDKALEILEFTDLIHLKDDYAGILSGGQKKLLELAKSMMADPELVLLDEPGAGVNPALMKKLVDKIRTLQQTKQMAFLLIEHDMDMIMSLCEPVIVMSEGKKLAEGTPEEIKKDERVLEAYLGGQYR